MRSLNGLSAHVIHVNLNIIFYTHVVHSRTKIIYVECYTEKQFTLSLLYG